MKPYTISLKPGANTAIAASKLAHFIVERWVPGNAGGVHVLITPRIAETLRGLWEEANAKNQERWFRVALQGNMPAIIELDD